MTVIPFATMAIVLALVAVLLAAVGVVSLTQATTGVGLIAGAFFLGIMARVAQARDYEHRGIREQGTAHQLSPTATQHIPAATE